MDKVDPGSAPATEEPMENSQNSEKEALSTTPLLPGISEAGQYLKTLTH